MEELSDVVLDLAADGQGLRDVEIRPQAGVLAVRELVARATHTVRTATDGWAGSRSSSGFRTAGRTTG